VSEHGGTIRDIRTGRSIGRTSSLTKTFVAHIQALVESDMTFYVVFGRCRMKEQRQMVDDLRELEAFPVIYDSRMPSDTMWIFEGEPEELGFAV
jgi:hypothetical protein